MFEIIKKLTQVYGVSGEESEIRDTIINEVKNFADEFWVDNIGNLIVKKRGLNGKKVVLTTNMDTRGVMITEIMDNGLLKFMPIGSQSKNDLYGQVIMFKNKVEGIIIAEKNINSGGFSGEVYIDIDTQSKEESEQVIEIGDTGVVSPQFKFMKNRIRSSALKNRTICGIYISLLKDLKIFKYDVYFIFTVQGIINGLRSVEVPLSKIKPDIMIYVDTISTNIIKNLSCSINKGPVLNIVDSEVLSNPKLINILNHISQKNSINLQKKFNINKRSKMIIENREVNLVKNARVSIPCQNMDSSFETMSMNDINQTKMLLEGFISGF